MLTDRLGELLAENDVLYGLTCRDLTHTDLELMAQVGYHIVWIDLEHGPQSNVEALALARTASHLGIVPLVRIVEMSRTHVQGLLDGGVEALVLPDIRTADEAARFVELGKYPPMGQRGVSSTSAGTGFRLGADPLETLKEANGATRLMVMFESDEGYENRDDIMDVAGVDLATVGPMDWSVGLGLAPGEAKPLLEPKIEAVLESVAKAGKMATMSVTSSDEMRRYRDRGVRVFFLGVDISLKRQGLEETLARVTG